MANAILPDALNPAKMSEEKDFIILDGGIVFLTTPKRETPIRNSYGNGRLPFGNGSE